MFFRHKPEMVSAQDALPGRTDQTMPVPERHFVLDAPLVGPWPDDTELAAGVYSTSVGYAGGYTPNATYEEACSGRTGHAEVVLVVFRPAEISYEQLLRVFWENHDPTQGMRQGNDIGTQYRSAVYTTSDAQAAAVAASQAAYGAELAKAGYGAITTEVKPLEEFYYAEPYHQQYLAKNPNGYCGIGGTGVSCPVGIVRPQV
jgi:peptide-methionine (S)-S-oxide reductase